MARLIDTPVAPLAKEKFRPIVSEKIVPGLGGAALKKLDDLVKSPATEEEDK